MKHCNFCKSLYTPALVARSLGRDSQPYKLGFCSARCYTQFSQPKISENIIALQTDTPAFATIPADQFKFVCRKFGLAPTDGVQPATKQAVICSPDGTAAVFFICHVEAVPAVNVTLIDGEVGAIVHDKI